MALDVYFRGFIYHKTKISFPIFHKLYIGHAADISGNGIDGYYE